MSAFTLRAPDSPVNGTPKRPAPKPLASKRRRTPKAMKHARRLPCAELPRDTSAGQRLKEAVKKATTGRQPGLDYVAMANWQFRRTALGMSQVMRRLGLWPDWKQEVALAAHEAERGRMSKA
jgi:hypothetical protein